MLLLLGNIEMNDFHPLQQHYKYVSEDAERSKKREKQMQEDIYTKSFTELL